MNERPSTPDFNEVVTHRIIESLKAGIVPWRKPWTVSGTPMNLVSKYAYKGINIWLLNSFGFQRNYFLTFEQIKELGGSVKKGQQGCVILSHKPLEDGSGEWKTSYYKVFNIEQCSGLPEHVIPVIGEYDHDPVPTCKSIIGNMQDAPRIALAEGTEASYSPALDIVYMPDPHHYSSEASYYQVLLRMLVHSTGHRTRLKRKDVFDIPDFSPKPFSTEALIGEMGLCHLASIVGMKELYLDTSDAYRENWILHLQNNRSLIAYASRKAQTAVNFILGTYERRDAVRVSEP